MAIDEIMFPLDHHSMECSPHYSFIVLCCIVKCLPSMRQSNPDHCFDIRMNSEQWDTEIINIGEGEIFEYFGDEAFKY